MRLDEARSAYDAAFTALLSGELTAGAEQAAAVGASLAAGDHDMRTLLHLHNAALLRLAPTLPSPISPSLCDHLASALEHLLDGYHRYAGGGTQPVPASRFLDVLQNMPVMLNALDEQGRFVFWNRRCEEVTGYSAEEIVGHPRPWELLYPDDEYRERMLGEWGERRSYGVDAECDLVARDGSVRTVAWSNISALYPIPGWHDWAIGVDVTAGRQTERALRESAELHRTLIASTSQGYWRIAPDLKTVDVNQSLCDMLGYSRDEIIGRHPMHFAEGPGVQTILNAVSRIGTDLQRRYEVTLRHCSGRDVHVIMNATTLHDGAGQVAGSFALVTDVTDLKRVEAALRESETRFSKLFYATPVVVTVADGETGQLVDVNDEFCRRAGFSREEAIGRTSVELGIFGSDARQEWLRDLVPGAAARRREVSFRRKDGTIAYGVMSAEAITLSGREHILSVSVDITERRQAEELYRALFDQAGDAVFVHAPDGRLLDVNDRAAELVGLSREDLPAMAALQAGAAESDTLRELLARLVRGGSTGHETELRRADGTWVEVSVDSRVIDAARGVAQAVVRDLTAGKREERARRARLFALESMERVDRAIRGTDDLDQMLSDVIAEVLSIFEADRAWLLYPCDPEAAFFTVPVAHTRPAYPIGIPTGEPIVFDEGNARIARDLQASHGPVAYGGQGAPPVEGITAATFLVRSLLAVALHPKVGAPWALGLHQCSHEREWTADETALLQDIGRRLADALSATLSLREARDSETRLQAILSTVPTAVMIVETESGLIQYANSAALQLIGAGESSVVGQEYRRFVTVPGQEPVPTEPVGQRTEAVLLRGDGQQRTVLRTVAAVALAGRPCLVEALLDITDHKKAEDAQRLATVGQLSAGVAHEFNNILAILSGRAQLAQAIDTPEEHHKLMEAVLRGTQRGASISEELMRFARPQEPRRVNSRVEEALEAALSIASRQVETAGIHVRRHYDAAAKMAFADPGQLEQVFLNLIINACHAMVEGGTLSLAVTHAPSERGEGDIVVTIADTGAGIAPEHLHRIFEPFFTTKGRLGDSETPGTGLGLSVSHGIIKAHGGEITVRSEVGVGTTFEVRLPAVTGAAGGEAPQPTGASSPGPRSGSGLVILVAEDDGDVRQMIVDLLENEGFTVVAVADAQQAAAELGRAPFDVVVSDLLMPGGGGRRVIAEATRLDPPPPVVVLTGRLEEDLTEDLIRAGAALCLRKPVDVKQLLAAIAEAVGER